MKIIYLILVLSILFVTGCNDTPKYKRGDIVCSKIDNHPGMVVHYHSFDNAYSVRFGSMVLKTNTHILTNDGPISSTYPIIYMGEFEIGPCGGEKK